MSISLSRTPVIAAIIMWASIPVPFEIASAESLSDRVSDILQKRTTLSTSPPRIVCRRELLCGPRVLPRFYSQRAFRPAWSTDDAPLPQAGILVEAIQAADREGLRPDDYHLANIQALLAEIHDRRVSNRPVEPEMLADLDLLLTDAFLLYGSHLLAGHVNPETIRAEWFITSREPDMVQVLETALDGGEVDKALENLRPQHPGYERLKRSLLNYRDIMKRGGWPEIPGGPRMEKDDRGPRVSALRSRLIASGDLDGSPERDYDLFDEALEWGVRRFQKRHGLKVDGIVGSRTLKTLNVPVEERMRQIELNMERWRWLPNDLGRRFILVNIPNFELYVVENDEILMTMRAVVGRRYQRTPVFTGEMTYLELNPYWHIPTKIATRDILPNIRKNPRYLIKRKIRVFQSWDAQAPEIDPESIDWSQITTENFSFKLRQEPGPSNALGRVKFMFPNRFAVYLHDTPARKLFQKTRRTFSAGCIRIEKPVELAAYLLRSDPEWTHERIRAAIDTGQTQIIRIPEPVAVYLLYWTTWVDEDGTLHFRDDIYGRDRPVEVALQERPPTL